MSKKLLYGFILITAIGVAFYGGMKTSTSVNQHENAFALKAAMRKLWEDHIVWTRNYIISELADLGDLKDVVQRLLQNQVDIGIAIQPFYGQEASKQLTSLLKEHIVLASDVVKAAKAKDEKKLKSVTAQWYKNAATIAEFLAQANSHWSKKTLQDMLFKHLEYTTGEAVSRLQQKWNDDIHFYDINHDHMLMFSDMLIDGIMKQFSNKIR